MSGILDSLTKRHAEVFLFLLVIGLASPIAKGQDVRVSPVGVYQTFASSLPWSTASRNFVFRPLAPQVSVYLFITNNNPTSSHALTLSISQTPKTDVADYTNNTRYWIDDSVTGTCTTVAASTTVGCYVTTMFAAQVAIRIGGTASAAGTPDTVDIFIVQSVGVPNGSTVGSGATSIVVGPTAPGSAPGANSPVQMGLFDGTNIQRVKGSTSGGIFLGDEGGIGDARSSPTPFTDGGRNLATSMYAFNGGTNDQVRAANLANFPTSQTLTARNSIGAALTEKGSRWSVVSLPASGTSASSVIAAEVSVRHVADCVTISASSTAAVTASTVTVTLADGATNIWAIVVALPTASGAGVQLISPFTVCGLNLVGTTNTAMTLTVPATVGVITSSVLTGFNVN